MGNKMDTNASDKSKYDDEYLKAVISDDHGYASFMPVENVKDICQELLEIRKLFKRLSEIKNIVDHNKEKIILSANYDDGKEIMAYTSEIQRCQDRMMESLKVEHK